MNAPFYNQPYPVEAFHHLVKDALLEVNSVVQAPLPLSSLSILSAMSAVVQRVADVCLPIGPIKPASVFALVLAGSGDRKTTVDEIIMSPISEHDKAGERQFAEHRDNFEKE